jgi:hypothetical protein
MADNKFTNKSAETGRESVDEAARILTNEAARVGEQTARAGADVANRVTARRISS